VGKLGFVLLLACFSCNVVLGLDGLKNRDAGGADACPPCGCLDFDNDGANCGRCGHDCLSGTCTKGVCDPVMLASGQAGPWDIATNGTDVVWSNIVDNTIMKWPSADGGVVQLATSPTPKGVAIDSTYAYWAGAGDTAVKRIALAGGGTPTTLATTTITPYAVAVDTTYVYWTEDGNSNIMRVPTSGGTPVPLAAGGHAQPIALDDVNVYWADCCVGTITRVPKDGGTTFGINVGASASVTGLASDGVDVFFSNSVNNDIEKVGIGGGGTIQLASGQTNAQEVAIDADNVYFAAENTGIVGAVSKKGGTVTVLASGQASPKAVAIDDKSVYWTTNSTIMRVAKP
jgi:hypothetical protein